MLHVLTAALLVPLAVPAPAPALDWGPCADDIPGVPVDAMTVCAELTLPVDWSDPRGETFELSVAKHPARPEERVGALVFGPGGPSDSGVERVRRLDRWSPEAIRKFDIVSFDPRGVGRSEAPACPPPQPELLTGQADFEETARRHRELWATCGATSAVFDHASTLSAVRDVEALRRALGEPRLTFQGSSYGTLLGQQYAERYPGRVRAIMLDGVFDHSLGVREFVRTQAATLQDSFDEFVAWCDRTACLAGEDARAVWNEAMTRADQGGYPNATAFDLALLPLRFLAEPNWPTFAAVIRGLDNGTAPDPRPLPLATAVFCADWPTGVRNYDEYAGLVRAARRAAPDVRYGAGLVAVQTCLGWRTPVANPPRDLRVTGPARLLLLNALHDPRTGHNWATHVAGQLGRHGRLVTYEGWGHGTYLRTACTIAVTDRYLVDLELPPPGTRCAAG